jgi:Domain of unknown function (DUF4278)
MQRIYRGNAYDYDPAQFTDRPFQPVVRSGQLYTLMYRGCTYQVNPEAPLAEMPIIPRTHELIYRGTVYLVTQISPSQRSIQVRDRDLFAQLKRTGQRLSLKLSGARS